MQWVHETSGNADFCTQLLRKAAGEEASRNSCQSQERCISKGGGALEAPENVAVNLMVKVSIIRTMTTEAKESKGPQQKEKLASNPCECSLLEVRM